MNTADSRREEILQLIEAENFSEAIARIESLSQQERSHGRIIIALADCYYELSRDLDALPLESHSEPNGNSSIPYSAPTRAWFRPDRA